MPAASVAPSQVPSVTGLPFLSNGYHRLNCNEISL